MENSKFASVLKSKGATLYSLSKSTGIPYTTVREIANGKVNINQCSAETVLKLAVEFGVAVEEILNPFCYIKNTSGKYRGYRYTWVADESGAVSLSIHSKDEDALLVQSERYTLPSAKEVSALCAEMIIDNHLKKREFERLCDSLC